VALQGTLDMFALADVLRLLASTDKTGCLHVVGDRVVGGLWLDRGRIVGTALADRSPSDPVHEVAQLLGCVDGSFEFEAGAEPIAAVGPFDLEELLASAGAVLEECRAIEAVVPSSAATVSLRAELAHAEVVLHADRWLVVAAVAHAGGSPTVAELAERLGLDTLGASRAVKGLVEAGLAEVVAAPSPVTPILRVVPNPFPEPETAEAATGDGDDAGPTDGPRVVRRWGDVLDDLDERDGRIERAAGRRDTRIAAPPSSTELSEGLGAIGLSEPSRRNDADDAAFAGSVDADEAGAADDDGPSVDDAAEIARQLANLSPRAAKAVAAAAKATTDEERDAALAAVEAEDGTVNRGLLLKFLGSVDS